MPTKQRNILDIIFGLGCLGIISAILLGAFTYCPLWHHSYCEDSGVSGTITTIVYAIGGAGVIMFFVGGIGREIRIEGKLTPGVDNEIRRQHEMGSITRKPLLPNAMILIGLILAVGVSTTLVGQTWNLVCFILGVAIGVGGYLLKRRHVNRQYNSHGLDSEA